VDVGLSCFYVNAELILLVIILPHHIFFKDTFWVKSAVCFSEQIAISNFYRHVKDKSVQAYFRCFFYISVWGIWCFFGRTLTLKLYIIWQINCCAIYWYFKNINLYFYKLLVVLTYYWSLKVASIKLLSHCKVIFAYLVARPGYCTELLQTEF